MDFKFSYHFNDYRNIKRTVYFQLSGTEYAIQIIQNLDFIDAVKIIDEGVMLSIAIQQVPEVVCALAQNNIAIYSIKIET